MRSPPVTRRSLTRSQDGAPDRDALDHLERTEWVLTNGLGSYAMGTALGLPTRRYHALLNAALVPPVERTKLLAATVDTLLWHDAGAERRAELSTFRFSNAARHPDGCSRLVAFETNGLSVRWTFRIPEIDTTLTRALSLIPLTNAALLTYETSGGADVDGLELRVRPLLSHRNHHHLLREGHTHNGDGFHCDGAEHGLMVHSRGVGLRLRSDGGAFVHEPQWWYDFLLDAERRRAQDCIEDLFSPGDFRVSLESRTDTPRATLILAELATDDTPPLTFEELADRLAAHRLELMERAERTSAPAPTAAPNAKPAENQRTKTRSSGGARQEPAVGGIPITEAIERLTIAADAFVVRRASTSSVIAGYPWFADWGRDAMISHRGLYLATGRTRESLDMLRAFADARRNGLIPNCFDDRTGEPQHNTVDASLWFLHSACEHLDHTADRKAFNTHLAPACLDIVDAYRRGTDFSIAMDPADHLITAGTEATQLTWMDARRDGVVFTPRHGKAVEINALWCSGLRRLSDALSDSDRAASRNLRDLADAAAHSFRARFWSEQLQRCHDCLIPPDASGAPWRPTRELRPNQLFAVSLPHSPLSQVQQRAVVASVQKSLVISRGVRTLDPADSRYRPRYEGSLFERDAAYHNGTAWPWLLGPLAEATLISNNHSPQSVAQALALFNGVITHLLEGPCPGQIAEVYDGDDLPNAPSRAGGCPAQAWSVAEALRILVEINRLR